MLNHVAAALAKSHPKVMLGPLIYSQTDHPMPDGAPPLADNILIGVANISRDSYRPMIGEPKSAMNMRYLSEDVSWMAKSKHIYVYEYYHCWIDPFIYPGAQVIARDLETFQQLGIQGVCSDMYGYTPINMYVAARALWSPNIDWKEAIRDFCRRYYDDVASEMAENQLRLEKGVYGLAGYQSDLKSPAGEYLTKERPGQIVFLKEMIAKTKDAQVKVRLERQLKPWNLWNDKPRWWAFPDFKDVK
jgi:hypothetical protein